jgi:hypothetical protein
MRNSVVVKLLPLAIAMGDILASVEGDFEMFLAGMARIDCWLISVIARAPGWSLVVNHECSNARVAVKRSLMFTKELVKRVNWLVELQLQNVGQ